MESLKSTALHRLALHCGYRSETTKAARLAAIAQSSAFFNSLHTQPLNVLSVDIGIKHFSYSKVAYSGTAAAVQQWRVLNLHDAFGRGAPADPAADPAQSKAYLAHLAVGVVDRIFLGEPWTPSIVTIENQRTRSNGNKATLPNVLLNFTLEHMLYAAFAARQAADRGLANTTVVPMNASKMVNFWLARFVAPASKIPPAQSKAHRTRLLYSWLSDPHTAPFDLASVRATLPADFGAMPAAKQKRAVQAALGLSKTQKMDDLVDSLLYNLTIAKQLQHHRTLQECKTHDDMLRYLDVWDADHKRYLAGLERDGLVLV